MSNLFSKDFLDQYKDGKRSFENITVQFADMQSSNLMDISIKNSKLLFVSFFNSDLSNAKFINCEIFFGSFYGCSLKNAVFDKCKINLTLFDSASFRDTKIIRSDISYSGFFNTNTRELDMSTSSQFKVFTDPSQIAESDVEAGLSLLSPHLDKLDTEIKSKIKKMLEWDAKTYGLSIQNAAGSTEGYRQKESYSKTNMPYGGGISGYGGQMENILHGVIDAYTQAHQKRKSSYSPDSKYK